MRVRKRGVYPSMNFQRRPRQQRASDVGVPLVAKARVIRARLSAWKNNRNARPIVVPELCWPSGREVPILVCVRRKELGARPVSSDSLQQRVSDLHELCYGSRFPPGLFNRRRRQALHHSSLTPDRGCVPRLDAVRGESRSSRSYTGRPEKTHPRQNRPKHD